MPLMPGILAAPPDEGTVVVPTIPYTEPVGRPVFSWLDPDGQEWPLSNTAEDLGWFTLMGPTGWGASPIEFTTDSLPRGGESVRAIASKPITLQWPLEVFGSNHQEFVERWRTISRAFKLTTRRQRPGMLRCQRPDGGTREIEAFYSEGFGGDAEQGHLFARPVVQLFCPDGKWRDVDPVVIERSFIPEGDPEPGPSFFDPFLSVSSSRVVGLPEGGGEPDALTTVVNPGDVEAWPVWTITGPMTELRATNTTLDARFALTYNLLTGQTIQITTDMATVRGPADVNLAKYIDWFNPIGTELWPLTDGENVIELEIDGVDLDTRVELAFTPRYDNS